MILVSRLASFVRLLRWKKRSPLLFRKQQRPRDSLYRLLASSRFGPRTLLFTYLKSYNSTLLALDHPWKKILSKTEIFTFSCGVVLQASNGKMGSSHEKIAGEVRFFVQSKWPTLLSFSQAYQVTNLMNFKFSTWHSWQFFRRLPGEKIVSQDHPVHVFFISDKRRPRYRPSKWCLFCW